MQLNLENTKETENINNENENMNENNEENEEEISSSSHHLFNKKNKRKKEDIIEFIKSNRQKYRTYNLREDKPILSQILKQFSVLLPNPLLVVLFLQLQNNRKN
jgi:hypothetical protein